MLCDDLRKKIQRRSVLEVVLLFVMLLNKLNETFGFCQLHFKDLF